MSRPRLLSHEQARQILDSLGPRPTVRMFADAANVSWRTGHRYIKRVTGKAQRCQHCQGTGRA